MSSTSIVRAGACTPIGLNARQTGFLLRAGLPAIGEAPLADCAESPLSWATCPRWIRAGSGQSG